MKIRRLWLIALMSILILILGGLLAVPATGADGHLPVTGDFTVVSSVDLEPPQIDDDVIIVHRSNTISFSGDLVGTVVCDVLGEAELATGESEFKCQGTFSGSLNDAPGTLEVKVDGTGNVLSSPPTFQAQFEFFNGTGELEGVKIEGAFEQVGLTGTYAGWVDAD